MRDWLVPLMDVRRRTRSKGRYTCKGGVENNSLKKDFENILRPRRLLEFAVTAQDVAEGVDADLLTPWAALCV